MRVTSTGYAIESSIRDLRAQRDALEHTQAQVTSGRRVVDPSDDPIAAADGERARAALARIDMERRALTFARNALGTADGALSDATGLLQNARETLMVAGNGTYDASDRAKLAEQLSQTRDQLLAVANRPDGSGGYVFGGLGTRNVPFREGGTSGATVGYVAPPGEQRVGQELALSTSLDGRGTFTGQAAGGATQNIFDVFDRAIATLRDPAATSGAIGSGMNAAIGGVDTGIDAMSVQRTRVGEQLRAIDAREDTLSGREINVSAYRSDTVEVDLAQALSQLSGQQTALDAAMKTYAQVSQMSLFKYL